MNKNNKKVIVQAPFGVLLSAIVTPENCARGARR
jgi:hypothetical protein